MRPIEQAVDTRSIRRRHSGKGDHRGRAQNGHCTVHAPQRLDRTHGNARPCGGRAIVEPLLRIMRDAVRGYRAIWCERPLTVSSRCSVRPVAHQDNPQSALHIAADAAGVACPCAQAARGTASVKRVLRCIVIWSDTFYQPAQSPVIGLQNAKAHTSRNANERLVDKVVPKWKLRVCRRERENSERLGGV
jgi:hypothetical protein